MKLYRVRNKNTGEYLYSKINPSHEGQWGPSGSFWKKSDTDKKHIEHLMHGWNLKPHPAGIICCWYKGKYLKSREGVFEVVINDVTVNSEEVISAEDILGIKEPTS